MTDGVRFTGILYRALNPLWAAQPLSGAGAARYGGRFNRRGRAALYCSLSPMTAVREANQAGDLQPTTLVALDADLAPLFDARDPALLASAGTDAVTLADPGWREAMRAGRLSAGQALAEQLIQQGYAGMLAPSYARGATAEATNIVLWRWGDAAPHRLTLIDDENRLGGL